MTSERGSALLTIIAICAIIGLVWLEINGKGGGAVATGLLTALGTSAGAIAMATRAEAEKGEKESV